MCGTTLCGLPEWHDSQVKSRQWRRRAAEHEAALFVGIAHHLLHRYRVPAYVPQRSRTCRRISSQKHLQELIACLECMNSGLPTCSIGCDN